MRRALRRAGTGAILVAVALFGRDVPEAIAGMEAFRIADVRIQGLRYVPREEILDLMALPSDASVWQDRRGLEARVAKHPLVRAIRVERALPSTLRVYVDERTPVALVPTPVLEPVDAEGIILPLDPAEHRLDLPILDGIQPVAPGARLVPWRLRRLAAEVDRLVQADPSFMGMVSELEWEEGGVVAARWNKPQVRFLLSPDAPARRLREGLTVLADAMARTPAHPPSSIDLRYADQVVVRRNDGY